MRIAVRCIIAAGLMVSVMAARAEGIIPPQLITVTPDTVNGDSTQTVSVCINDLTAPSYIGWRISNFPDGLTGSLNGVATQGNIGPRESDGCVHNVSVLTHALPPTLTYSPQFLFHAAGQFLTYDGTLHV